MNNCTITNLRLQPTTLLPLKEEEYRHKSEDPLEGQRDVPQRLFHVVDFHPYPVGEPIWLGGKELHIPWSQYSLTLCGMSWSESREEVERASLSRQNKDTCEKCQSLVEGVLNEYLDHKKATREHT